MSANENKKIIAVLGATGSVGTQALDVARSRGYAVDFLSAGRNVAAAEAAARAFSPRAVAMADESSARDLAVRLSDTDVRVLSGADGIVEGIAGSAADVVVNAILGEAGLRPTLAVIAAGKRLALANKESLVIAGDIVMRAAEEAGVDILPVDSEHSAIFQSLRAGRPSEIRRLLLTASGGPFFGYTKEKLRTVTKEDALRHPTWNMGKKITVDSATLMNKGFEVIEAAHLFGVSPDRIEVVVHRESILHSAVEYIDNTVIGEMSVPDMRMCVQYAVDYPERHPSAGRPLDLFSVGTMTFARPDTDAFPLLAFAGRAHAMGGGMGAVLNAADEVAVGAFLDGHLPFWQIAECVSQVFDACTEEVSADTPDLRIAADRHAREVARDFLGRAKQKG